MTKNIGIKTNCSPDIMQELETKIAKALGKRPNQIEVTGKYGIESFTEKFQAKLKDYRDLLDNLNDIKMSLEIKNESKDCKITKEEILSFRLTLLLKISTMCESVWIDNSVLVIDTSHADISNILKIYEFINTGYCWINDRTFLTVTEDDLSHYDDARVVDGLLTLMKYAISGVNNIMHELVLSFKQGLSTEQYNLSVQQICARDKESVVFSKFARDVLYSLIATNSIIFTDEANRLKSIAFYDKCNNKLEHNIDVTINDAETNLDIYARDSCIISENVMNNSFDFYVPTQGAINDCLSDTSYIGNCIPDELLNPVLKFIEDNKEHLMKELKIPKYAVGKTEEHENSGFGMWSVPSPSCYAPSQGFARNPRHYDEPEHRLGARLSEFKGLFGEDSNTNKPINSMNTHSHDIPTQLISGKRNRNRLDF